MSSSVASWITEEGLLDPIRLPIDSVLKQSLAEKGQDFRTGCTLLGSMQSYGRTEAGGYLRTILNSLSCFSVELVADGLGALAKDSSFSYKMRRKFRNVLEDMAGARSHP